MANVCLVQRAFPEAALPAIYWGPGQLRLGTYLLETQGVWGDGFAQKASLCTEAGDLALVEVWGGLPGV